MSATATTTLEVSYARSVFARTSPDFRHPAIARLVHFVSNPLASAYEAEQASGVACGAAMASRNVATHL